MSANLEISREERVCRLVLNRPDKRNALSAALCHELVQALDNAERDSSVGAILLTGNGPVFCAGMDLDEVLDPGAAARTAIHEKLFTFGSRITKPVVAAVSGAALGGGLGLVANPHVAVAAQGSSFGLTEIRIGMWPFFVFRSIAAAIGERRALELSLTGRIFGTQEALQWGLVHHVTPAFELDDRAWEIAANLAAASPRTIRSGLEFACASRRRDWAAAGELAAEFRRRVFESDDFREGVQAFREKRKPQWPSLKKG